MNNYNNVKPFKEQVSEFLQILSCSLVGSSQSASHQVFLALTSPQLKERAISCGDEIITTTSCIFNTLAPFIQFGAVPVIVDISIPHYNIDVLLLEEALSPKTKAVLLSHALANPFDVKAVKTFCSDNNLWLIEDNYNTIGSLYMINNELLFTGTFGDICISGFLNECVSAYTSNQLIHKIILGINNQEIKTNRNCGKLENISSLSLKRRQIWSHLREGLLSLQAKLILPEAAPYSVPSWLGFAITCREETNRNNLVMHLIKNNVKLNYLYPENHIQEIEKLGGKCKISSSLDVTNRVLKDTFYIDIYPDMSMEDLDKIINAITKYFE